MKEARQLPTFPIPDKRKRPAAAEYTSPPPVAAKVADPAIVSLVSAVDAALLANSVKSLAHFPTRHSLSPHNVEAAKWLRDQFVALGYTDVALHDFTIGGVTRHNVVCTKHGSTNPTKYILVGAHYDSRMSDLSDITASAPGSDDNGSGSAALLELARVLKAVDTPCSIRFIAFSGEEQGLIGSTAYADSIHAVGLDVRLMINLDMIGFPEDAAHPTIIVERDLGNAVAANDAASQADAGQMVVAAATYTSLKTKLGPIYDSDYMPFEHYGYVCVGAFDGADGQPFYHSTTDTPDKVNGAFHAEVVRLVAATIVTLAGH